MVLGASTSALAHDEIVGTTPSAGSQVAPGTLKVSVTFGEAVMDVGNGDGLDIQVTSPDGVAASLPCLNVDGDSIWAALDATQVGTYQVDWRSVSSDGHANADTFTFEVAEGAAAGESPAPDAICPVAYTSHEPEPTATATDVAVLSSGNPTTGSGDSGSKLDPLTGLGFGIALFVGLSLIGIAVSELQKRARARKEALKSLKAEVEANPDLLRDL
jgi:methionine-rich copper-binding protein CopC